MNFHCVRTGVKAEDVTIDDLTIPDSYCNPKKGGSANSHMTSAPFWTPCYLHTQARGHT